MKHRVGQQSQSASTLRSVGRLALICAALLGCQDGEGILAVLHVDYPQQHQLIALLGSARRTRPRFSCFGPGPCDYETRQLSAEWPMQCAEAPRLKPAEIRALRALWSTTTRQEPSAD